MLIDLFAPNPDAVEIHRINIQASPQTVYHALWTTDLGDSFVIKFLMALRSIPEFVASGFRSKRHNRKVTLQTIIDAGFGILAEKPDEEIVLGVTGRFWRPMGNLSSFHRADFDRTVPAGMARALWNFQVRQVSNGQTTLGTETRVVCGDPASRRKFRLYWLFVRPFSGLIRLLMLRKVRKIAEASTPHSTGRPGHPVI